jgi:hypothetical protein
VLPPIADDEADEALKADQDRPDKGEDGYLVRLDRQVRASAVRGHDHGDGAAIRQIRDAHGARSLRARWFKAQPDYPHPHHIDGPRREDLTVEGPTRAEMPAVSGNLGSVESCCQREPAASGNRRPAGTGGQRGCRGTHTDAYTDRFFAVWHALIRVVHRGHGWLSR